MPDMAQSMALDGSPRDGVGVGADGPVLPKAMPGQRHWHSPPGAFWVLLALYAALTLAYNYAFPPFEPSDEIDHFRYVRYLIEHRRLPRFQAADLSEYHQPPLYYALSAALSWPFPANDLADYAHRKNPFRGFRSGEPSVDNKNLYLHGPWDRWPFQETALALHVARLASLLAGITTVLLTYQIARAIADETIALASASMVALNPMFLAVSGSLQNDAGAAASGAVVLGLGILYHQIGFTPRRAAILGLAVGIASLAKITAAPLLLPAVFMVLARSGERQQSPSRRVAMGGWLVIGAAAGGGWWVLRNYLIYGDPTFLTTNLNAYGRQSPWQGIALWGQSLPYAWTTFWGRFGHGDLVLPAWIYQTLAAFSVVALAGLALRWQELGRSNRVLVQFLGVAGLVELAGLLVYLSLSPTGAYGRYTFPALPAYMTLFAAGLLALVPGPLRRRVTYAIPTVMSIFAVGTLVLYILPAYSAPAPISSLPAGAHTLDAVLGDVAVLKGYQVDAVQAQPGDRIYVTLYWQPIRRTDRPYSVFVHLFDSEGILIAQRDTYPGLGRNSTVGWTPNQMFADDYLVVIPETAYAPVTGQWEAGLWQADTGDRAFVLGAAGQPVTAGVSFGRLTIHSLPGTLPNPVDLNFGGKVRLKGYSLPTRSVAPGHPFDLTLYWQADAQSTPPFLFFVHIVAPDGRSWANHGFELQGGPQTVQPVLASDTPPGTYSLVVEVFYNSGTDQRRLKLLAEDGHELEDHVRLTGMRVIP